MAETAEGGDWVVCGIYVIREKLTELLKIERKIIVFLN